MPLTTSCDRDAVYVLLNVRRRAAAVARRHSPRAPPHVPPPPCATQASIGSDRLRQCSLRLVYRVASRCSRRFVGQILCACSRNSRSSQSRQLHRLAQYGAFSVCAQQHTTFSDNYPIITSLYSTNVLISLLLGAVSLSLPLPTQVCRWMAAHAEQLGVEIFPGFPASQLIYDPVRYRDCADHCAINWKGVVGGILMTVTFSFLYCLVSFVIVQL